jgi:hypothetical protein
MSAVDLVLLAAVLGVWVLRELAFLHKNRRGR